MATRPGRLLDKTFTSFTEASGRLEDTIGWVTAAEELAHEVQPGCKSEVTLHLLGKVLEKAARQLDQASEDLAAEIFDVDK
jgi:hypothetical protein|tara:strand:- start:7231 stop:7473 length:243 start_codon:yes stop_codon:yes gene_type:complete